MNYTEEEIKKYLDILYNYKLDKEKKYFQVYINVRVVQVQNIFHNIQDTIYVLIVEHLTVIF